MALMSRTNFTGQSKNYILSLTLDNQENKLEVFSENIEQVSLELYLYGFDCHIQFVGIDPEKIDQLFTSQNVIKADLSILSADPEKKGKPPLIQVKGIVLDQCFQILNSTQTAGNRIIRKYEIYFCDAAKATWSHHFPINIYVDESMKEIIEKHKSPEVSIQYKFDVLEKKHPITAFSLQYKEWLSEQYQVSFYSFLNWYLHQENGVLQYDWTNNTYTISEKKQEGNPFTIFDWQVSIPTCILPRQTRFNRKIIKHSSDTMDEEEKEVENVFSSIRKEFIESTNYTNFPEQAFEETKSKICPQQNIIEIETVDFSEEYQLDKILPGMLVNFAGDKAREDIWSADAAYKGQTFRINKLDLSLEKNARGSGQNSEVQSFIVSAKKTLELKSEEYVQRPPFNPPEFPFSIQGKVFSEIGETKQTTYKVAESLEAPLGQYLVLVPLAGEEKKVVVPFTPDLMSGQFYYPFCKNERVLLSMYFRTAKIQRIIDWQPLARLPNGTQGNQLVLSSNGEDQYVILKHEFVDGKNSVFTIKQSSSAEQTQTIEIQKENLVVSVEQKNKKKIDMNFNQTKGLVLSLDDKTTEISQVTHFDGKSMKHTCKGNEGTSVCTQTPESISIDCKKFQVNSDTINLNAKDSITQEGKGKVDITTKKATIKSPSVNIE